MFSNVLYECSLVFMRLVSEHCVCSPLSVKPSCLVGFDILVMMLLVSDLIALNRYSVWVLSGILVNLMHATCVSLHGA